MTKTFKSVLAGSVAVVAALSSTGAYAQSATADATATILEEVVVTAGDDLAFGTIVVGATGDDVSIAADGTFNCGANLTCTGTNSAASFSVSGTGGETVSVTVDGSVTLQDGANSMTASLTGSDTSLTLDGTGAASFTVGGVLTVADNQASGDYSGQFDVTVDYN
ncbi:DUF4402 domain-containing protein [Parasphingorhabdus sp. DH2-15]|uniref:DUF4402 domain-containing protein n=1 Tax=Parasphingorhabdus sp. DH2-15 TaxID=3444112 RepID=UPI003F683771